MREIFAGIEGNNATTETPPTRCQQTPLQHDNEQGHTNQKRNKPNNKTLPSFLLTNIQSFGIQSLENTYDNEKMGAHEKEKITELEAVLDINDIDVACITETWLTEASKGHILLDNYVHFTKVRTGVQRASGGVSILVKKEIPATQLKIKVPEHLEILWLSLRPHWLPR